MLSCLLGTCCLLLGAEKNHSGTVTAQMRANAQANIAKYPWAARHRKAAVRAAQRWLAMPDVDLWALVTPQSLPRTIHTTLIRGTNRVALCPKCREGIVPFGNYPWRIDATGKPWKLQCPNCNEIFPKNDFWAYYRSALDAHGKFQPGKGDRRLLFNAEHPDPADPLHKYGVDDGYGWFDETGMRWAFVAYYNSWGQWPMIYRALDVLVQAYLHTDDVRYAHKAGVLLDRIADVYPEMDLLEYVRKLKFEHSDGSSGHGKIEGSIWETQVATRFALAYDQVYDGMAADPALVTFLSDQARQHSLGEKNSFRAIQRNIEENLLLEIVKGCKDGQIHGNQGMHHVTMAAAAIALDRPPLTGQLLEWIFQPGGVTYDKRTGRRRVDGGNLAMVLHNLMDRDGMGNEGAPGYCCWGLTILTLADLLDRYPDNAGHSLFRDFPEYRQCFLTPLAWACLGQATPSIGDSGACGHWGSVGPGLKQLLTVFRAYHDPRIARRIWQLSGGRPERLPADIFAEDPEADRRQIIEMAAGPATPLAPVNLNGFGLAIMQTPTAENGRALWMYYGRNTGHGHRDRLNIGLYAHNLDMLPDLGYPEYASGRPMDAIWERNCISHNVVIVDDQAQQSSHTGRLLLWEPGDKAQLVEAESPGIFAGTTTYRRLTALVEASPRDSYAVDFFRVRGGRLHRQSWHGPAADAESPQLRLVPQAKGTFAGEATAFGQLPEKWRGHPGYMYLYDVRRDCKPPAAFALDYRAEDRRKRIAPSRQPHLRLTCLTPCDEVALAHGDPPQNKSGNPRRLQYAVLTRKGDKDLQSLFVTVIEPYDSQPIIRSARLLPLASGPKDQLAAAVEVALADGRVDTILCAESPATLAAGGVTMDGTWGIVSRRGGRVEFAKLVAGRSLAAPGVKLALPQPQLTGRVTGIQAEKADDQRVTFTLDSPTDQTPSERLAVFENDGLQDAAYTIRAWRKSGDAYELSTGESSLVRGYANPKNLAAGFVYNVHPGDRVRIPLSTYLQPAAGK